MKKLNFVPKPFKIIKSVNLTDVHEEDIAMDFFKEITGDDLSSSSAEQIEISTNGNFAGRAIFLNNYYDYILGTDSRGLTILVPLKVNRPFKKAYN